MNGLIKLEYVNHIGEKLEIGTGGIYAGSSDLRDYAWTATKRGNKISRLYRDAVKRSLPVLITAPTKEEAYALRNRLMEVTEKDVLAFQMGKIVCGGYYYRCFVTESKKPEYWKGERNLVVELSVETDSPVWVKENEYGFSPDSGSGELYLDFPVDYPYDYLSATAARKLSNSGFVKSDFRLTVFGACENPAVTISDHIYQVNTTLQSGEYLTIDSAQKTVIKTAQDGTKTNLFNSRNKESYIFEQIPPGSNPVTWDGSFNFVVTILEERSEPKWT